MKSKFYPLLLAPILFLASCTKWLPNSQQNVVGSWEIVSIEQQMPNGSQQVYSDYQSGIFYFSNNGKAQYSDRIGQMDGTWRLVPRTQDGTNSLELRLYDYHNSDAIEWEFYSVDVSSNRMVGYMNRNGYDYRYEFRRY